MNYKGLLKKELIALYLIILIGALLRFWGVFNNSFAFTYDVGRDMLSIWDLAHLIKVPLIGATTGINGVFYGPWWYYMLTPIFIIFSGNPQGIAFAMAFIGVCCIPLAYFIGNRIGNKFLGLAFAGLVGVSSQLISLSSQIWNPNIAPIFVLLTLFSLLKIYTLDKTKSEKYFLFLGLLLALNIDIEILWGILFASGIIISQIVILNKKIKIKQILYFMVGLFIIATPRIIFELRHGFIMTKSFVTFLTTKNTTEDPLTFLQLIQNRIFTYLDQFSSTLTFNNQLWAVVIIIFTLLIYLLFYKKASEIMRKFIVVSFITTATFFIGTIIFTHALWPHYLVGLPVIYIFLFTMALFLLQEKLDGYIIPGLILIFLFILNFNIPNQIDNFRNPGWIGNASVYRNQLAVIDYVYQQAKGKDFKYVVYTPPVFDYTYRYLFKWYGPKKYHYSPRDRAILAFFIIEPDPGYEDRPKQWLKLRESDGIIVKSQTLKSGIVVQTRITK